MDNLALRTRYLRDPLPVRVGGLAANLARVASFSNDPRHKHLVARLIEESEWFIEWTAAEASSADTRDLLVECQRQLARWHLNWDELWRDDNRRAEVAEAASVWSQRLLDASGLLGPSGATTVEHVAPK